MVTPIVLVGIPWAIPFFSREPLSFSSPQNGSLKRIKKLVYTMFPLPNLIKKTSRDKKNAGSWELLKYMFLQKTYYFLYVGKMEVFISCFFFFWDITRSWINSVRKPKLFEKSTFLQGFPKVATNFNWVWLLSCSTNQYEIALVKTAQHGVSFDSKFVFFLFH